MGSRGYSEGTEQQVCILGGCVGQGPARKHQGPQTVPVWVVLPGPQPQHPRELVSNAASRAHPDTEPEPGF